MLAEKLDANGSVVGSASTPNNPGILTALTGGGYVFTWINGSQLVGQFFTTSGTPAGASFVVADNLDTSQSSPSYSIGATTDGFVAVYQTAAMQVDEVQVKAPPLG